MFIFSKIFSDLPTPTIAPASATLLRFALPPVGVGVSMAEGRIPTQLDNVPQQLIGELPLWTTGIADAGDEKTGFGHSETPDTLPRFAGERNLHDCPLLRTIVQSTVRWPTPNISQF